MLPSIVDLIRYRVCLVQVASLKAKGLLGADGTVAGNRAFAAYYAGDYDGAAWLYNQLLSRWDDPKRGTVPIGWASKRLAAAPPDKHSGILLCMTMLVTVWFAAPVCCVVVHSRLRTFDALPCDIQAPLRDQDCE